MSTWTSLPSRGGKVKTFADEASRLAYTATDGELVVQLDTDSLYIWDGDGSQWILVGTNVVKHEELPDLMGGEVGEHYHLNAQQLGLVNGINDIASPSRLSATLTVSDNGDITVTSSTVVVSLQNSLTYPWLICAYVVTGITSSVLTENQKYLLVADYNGGAPIQAVRPLASSGANGQTIIVLGMLTVRQGGEIHWLDFGQIGVNSANKITSRLKDTEGLLTKVIGTAVVSSPSARTLYVTAGKYYIANEPKGVAAFDSSGTDTFTSVYGDNTAGFTHTEGITQLNNTHYWDNATHTLTALTVNRFSVRWIFQLVDNPDELYELIGDGEYTTLAAAQAAPVPAELPIQLQQVSNNASLLLARAIVQQGVADIIGDVFNITSGSTSYATVTSHNSLADIQGGAVGDYQHLTTTELNKLTGIEEGAEVNVQADWGVSDTNSDAYILNKPTIPSQPLFGRTGTVISNEYGTYATDDFVVGGTSVEWDGTNTIRLAFDRSKGALRVGRNDVGDAGGWSDSNVGLYSFAGGAQSVASGGASFAYGSSCLAGGNYAIAMGNNCTADTDSIAMGYECTSSNAGVAVGASSTATGTYSVALGYNSTATASWTFAANGGDATAMDAIAIGVGCDASADGATAIGRNAAATGEKSCAFGFVCTAHDMNEMSLGTYNVISTGSTDTWVGTDSLLVVGNGDSSTNRSNALQILKDGTLIANSTYTPTADNHLATKKYVDDNSGGASSLGDLSDVDLTGLADNQILRFDSASSNFLPEDLTVYTSPLTTKGDVLTHNGTNEIRLSVGTDGQVLSADSTEAGGLKWIDAGGGGVFSVVSNVIIASGSTYSTDDWVVGSPQLDDDGDTDHDKRMFFDKSKAAFRCGRVTDTSWDDTNRGYYSVVFGATDGTYLTPTYTGDYIFSCGRGCYLSGAHSVAIGEYCKAVNGGIALGYDTRAEGKGAFAVGGANVAAISSLISISALNDGAVAMGYAKAYNTYIKCSIWAGGRGSFAMGYSDYYDGTKEGSLRASNSGSIVLGYSKGGNVHSSGLGSLAGGYFYYVNTGSVTSSGKGSFAWGHVSNTTHLASGDGSFALGGGSTSSGYCSFTLGFGLTSSANFSLSQGCGSQATAECGVAMGNYAIAQGIATFACGQRTTANDAFEFVCGRYNIVSTGTTTSWVSTDSLFVIGNGTGDATRNNAMKVTKDGKIYFPDVYANHTTANAANVNMDSSGQILLSTSSLVFKTNVEDMLPEYAEHVYSVRPVYYRSLCETDPDDHSYWGLIAEELAEIDPRFVEFGYFSDDYEFKQTGETDKIVDIDGVEHVIVLRDGVETPVLRNLDPESLESPVLNEGEAIVQVPVGYKGLKDGATKKPHGVYYDRLVVPLIKCVQMQKAEIDSLKSELTAIKQHLGL